MSALVIGESCLDIFMYGECKRLCPEAPVPIFTPLHKTENEGMAYNVYNNLQSLSVDCSLHTNENHKTITKTRFIDEKTNHMFMRLDRNDQEYKRCIVRNIDFSQYSVIVVSDYNKGFLLEEDIDFIGKSHNCVFLDTKKILGPWCKNIDYIKVNLDEYEKTKNFLDKEVLKKLIITMGPAGAKYNKVSYPVPKVEIKDTSGAGDTFVAAMVAEYVKSQNIYESIKFGNRCATKVVQKKGVSIV